MDDTKKFPFQFQNLNLKEIEEINQCYKGTDNNFVHVGPKNYLVPLEYKKLGPSIYEIELRPKDICVITYQRSGTTLTQELVWLVVNDFDYETAKSILLSQRYAFLEIQMYWNEVTKETMVEHIGGMGEEKMVIQLIEKTSVEILAETPDPRFIKTHLPLSLLPPTLLDTVKTVYVARDPRDVAVSSYHQSKLFEAIAINKFKSEFKQLWNLFKNNLFMLTPYFEHVKEAWAQRNHPNMLFLFYEDLKKDLPSCIRKIAEFLGKNPTEEQISGLCDHLSFKNFQNNKAVNCEELRDWGLLDPAEKFIREGKTGNWQKYFDEEMTKEAELWIADNLRDTDLRFPSMGDIEI